MDVGAITPFLWMFEEREKIMAFYERVCGARLHAAYIRVGGVHQDLPPGLLDDIQLFVTHFSTLIAHTEQLLNDNRIFKQRSVDIGVIQREDALDWGFSGPVFTSFWCGLGFKKITTLRNYEELDFDIPIGKQGDCFDRYLVRMAEMTESLKLVQQCLHLLPQGSVMSADPRVSPPSRSHMKTSMESLIHHFKLYTEGFHVPAGECYAAVEAPKGEFGVYLVADGTNKPYRCKIRAPGFAFLQATDFMSKGYLLADVVLLLGL